MDVESLIDAIANVTGIRVEEPDRAPIARTVQRSIERAQACAAAAHPTAGSKMLADWVPDEDAHAVALLRGAGAVVVGKLNTHEFAYGASTINPHYGNTHNPWRLDCIPGGSSGGSGAAVAAGLCAG